MLRAFQILVSCLLLLAAPDCKGQIGQAFGTKQTFKLNGYPAFVMIPKQKGKKERIPWVWYAPTLGNGLPGAHEHWMFNQFHKHGLAIAGIDVGESYGAPKGVLAFQNLYEHLITNKSFSRRPVLLARSRGGLMLYAWAVQYPQSVGAIAGIYPVCNLISYPGLTRAAPAFQLTPDQLNNNLSTLNPIARLRPLAEARVPILHIHGDQDRVVPLEMNSQLLAKRIDAMGGNVKIDIIHGQGHNLWKGWFTNRELTDFIIKHARTSLDPNTHD